MKKTFIEFIKCGLGFEISADRLYDEDGDYETEDILGILGTRHLDGEVHKGRNQLRKEIINKLQTLIAAKQNGYQYIGIELEPEYIKIAKTRLDSIPERLL